MTHIDLVDQTFRDGQQCLWGMRLRTGMVTPVARELDTAGYSAIDITGSSMSECVLRYSREDPWEGLDHWRRVMPRTEFRRLGHTHGIDESTLPPVARNCERIAEQEGWPTGAPVEFDAFVYRHQLPGGMTGTLKAQLAQYGMTERLDEVLEECVRVRAEFGHPISATPFSQIVGIQAVLNIVTGDRYSM